MRDIEGELWLWTGESTDCVSCGHHLQYHHSVSDSVGICTVCVGEGDGDMFYHDFIARRQPLFSVRVPRSDYVQCAICSAYLPDNALMLAEHDSRHTIQEKYR